MNEKLKPCSFCGNSVKLLWYDEEHYNDRVIEKRGI
jgi:hypothetical protein